MNKPNVAASVRAKLLNLARETKVDFHQVLTRYALERLLYRISSSNYSTSFLLKGALLFDVWFDIPNRPTMDADFLGFGSAELPHLQRIFKEICEQNMNDGILFQSDTVNAIEIRKDANYAGVRITLLSILDGAKCKLQVDVGFGDAVTPAPETVDYPVMLAGFEPPKLQVYPKYTVIAEKFQALVVLGIANSRMKDYFDLWILSQYAQFEGEILQQAITATFERRKTPHPQQKPFGLTPAFSGDVQKNKQWQAFIRKNKLKAPELAEVIHTLSDFIMPCVIAITENTAFKSYWKPSDRWSS